MSDPHTYYVGSLTKAELYALDGKCSEKVQALVDQCRESESFAHLPESQAAMVAKIVALARSNGKLGYRHSSIDHCQCCGRQADYAVAKRTSRYVRKGEVDRSKPRLFSGTDLSDSFVFIRGHVSIGWCQFCRPSVEPVILKALENIPVEFPRYWEGAPHRWIKAQHYTCTKCGWDGPETSMRRRTTLMGDSTFPSGCPKCDAENLPFGRDMLKISDAYTMIEKGAQ